MRDTYEWTRVGHMKLQRIVLYLVVALCGIQFVRLYLENKYLHRVVRGRKINARIRRVPGGQTLDASGRYVVHRFFKSEGYALDGMEPRDVTLITHGTVDRLHHIIGLSETWVGPMSISIFAPGNDAAFADDVIDGLRLCWPSLRRTTTFHLVYPSGVRAQANMTGVGRFAYLSCRDIMRKTMLRKKSDNILYPKYDDDEVAEDLRYPHNLMRNVALSGAHTDFVASIDIEMIPSESLRAQFLDFASRESLFKKLPSEENRRTEKTVYVMPVFEVRQDEDIGRTKRALITGIKKGNARQYLQETCLLCHKQTNYDKWLIKSNLESRFGIGYEATFAAGWEPFVIAKRDSPWYDESMTQYGHDRLSQICELNSRGYKFLVINHGFLLRQSYRYRAKMKKAEEHRRDNKIQFRDEFRESLRKSDRIPKQHIRLC